MPTNVKGITYYTASEVAKNAGITRQTLWRWRQSGEAPSGRQQKDRRLLFTQEEANLVSGYAQRIGSFSGNSIENVYLDNASTTKPLKEVIDAMVRAMQSSANASSAHSGGAVARNILNSSRSSIAHLCSANPEEVIFTSGGTESNSIVLLNDDVAVGGVVEKVITTRVEHSSILDASERLEERGVQVTYLDVDSNGLISLEDLESLDIDLKTLVSIQWVNNETGVIQPIRQIAEHVRDSGGIMHTDASQALGKMDINFSSLPIDLMTCTAHKIHGPQGVGAILISDGVRLKSLLAGGSQERRIRPGTENVPGISGFGVAAKIRNLEFSQYLLHARSLRDYLETELINRFDFVSVVGKGTNRIGAITNIRFRGVDGQALVAMLDAKGVLVSQSSACTNMRPEPSYVLRAMGLSETEAYECLRFCVSTDTEFKDLVYAVESITSILHDFGVVENMNDRSEVA
jgi:cysteine desulfurase